MTQVFTLIAMEPPIRVSGTGSADYVRDAKVTVPFSVQSVATRIKILRRGGQSPGFPHLLCFPRCGADVCVML